MTTRQRRALRGGAASAVAVILAATSHTLGGGVPPAPWLVLTVALLAWPVAVALIGRRPSLVRTAAAVTAAQVLLHLAFAAVGAAEAPLPSVMSAPHVHTLVPELMPMAGAPMHVGFGMIFSHLVAAVVTTALFARGEAVLRAVVAGVRRMLSRPACDPRPAAALVPSPVPAPRASATAVFLSVLSRRGPPALAR
ncbi:hypothetical protein N3K63_14925 [Microbacterium sp. W1N]|uniref:hypothetical protein n=1 Tax=Microbacterium festucae TaxID=2977531 RepID=UPI0021C16E8F|nr:hypothetical protein [Microbacterium festucae]MCT9821578.1 hypothetical protein [Microbacterium festucae]